MIGWERRGLVWVPNGELPDDPRTKPFRFTPEERQRGHRLYNRGIRTPEVVAQHREYDRVRWQRARRRKQDSEDVA